MSIKRKYIVVAAPGHPKATGRGYVHEHVLVAEKMLGHFLPPGAIVHHKDGDGHNNDPSNLIICKDQEHHFLIHRQQDALKACGHADWIRCSYCKQYDDPRNLSFIKGRPGVAHHKKCAAKYQFDLKRRRQGGLQCSVKRGNGGSSGNISANVPGIS